MDYIANLLQGLVEPGTWAFLSLLCLIWFVAEVAFGSLTLAFWALLAWLICAALYFLTSI